MSTASGSPRTMFQKIWDNHVVTAEPGKQAMLYIDLHLVHEVTSPQAFEGLRLAGRKVRRPERTIATPDHNVPTNNRNLPIADPISRQQGRRTADGDVSSKQVQAPDVGTCHAAVEHVA